ncbi:MAG: 30S ribosomal protein S3 [Candidatus Methylarchaceae archaeon HK02M1]|nr:30S ribosomal protein S3 [Candidatus Methylarchaceae archaeon HK01M]MCP8312116.1 30S ribosomal protein S3 [Candidatus Methylarchaceae archaeon HK02M1]
MSAIKNLMKNYTKNAELDEFLQKELANAGYGGLDILKTPIGTRITIFATRPGLIIGRRGTGIKALTSMIEEKFDLPNPQISVLEVEVPELNPMIMCNRIARNVIRGRAFRRASLWALNSIMSAGAMGTEITVSGKLRSDRSHYEKHRAGIVPKSGNIKSKTVKEATTDVLLKMGLYGIKVKIALKDLLPPEVEIIEKKPKEATPKEEESDAETQE